MSKTGCVEVTRFERTNDEDDDKEGFSSVEITCRVPKGMKNFQLTVHLGDEVTAVCFAPPTPTT